MPVVPVFMCILLLPKKTKIFQDKFNSLLLAIAQDHQQMFVTDFTIVSFTLQAPLLLLQYLASLTPTQTASP